MGYLTDLTDAQWAATLLGLTLSIMKRPTNQKGFTVLARRWVVESTIAWLNHYRRLSKDFEHLIKNSEAMMYWSSIQRLLRPLAPPANQAGAYACKRGVPAEG